MDIDPDALAAYDDPDDEDIHAGLPWNHHARFDGYPGMVWYSDVRQVLGAALRVGDWLDSLDHRGARAIYGIWVGEIDTEDLPSVWAGHHDQWPKLDSPVRTVMFGGGDVEIVQVDVLYDVVNPDSQVTPDGTPVVMDEYPQAA